MVSLLYNALLLCAAFFLLPYYLFRGLKYGKSRRGIRERLGYYFPEFLVEISKQPVIWIHAVSVGETRAAAPLIKSIRQEYPDYKILLSNVTETGHAIALENRDVDFCIFFPFDFSWAVKKSLTLIQPEMIIIVETEIWPNFTRWAHRLNIPLLLVNGRLSDRSYPRYRRFRYIFKSILDAFAAFCMQSQADAERIMALGADSHRVENTGNLKFDHDLKDISMEEVSRLKASYRIPEPFAVMVAGSTHDDEEKQLLNVYKNMLEQLERGLVLILIPRHPERKRDIQNLLKDEEIPYAVRSSINEDDGLIASGGVLLVDTLGEVLDFYSIADLVFVGGSLVPIGGHNLLEASLLAKPVLFGPYVNNFKEISAKLVRAGAGIKVHNQVELQRQSVLMINDPARCRAMGEAGRSLIAENAGATQRTMRHITKVLQRQ